jgi:stage II sporulation protein E
VFSRLYACANNGAATFEDMDATFRRDCKSPETLLTELNAIFNTYRNDLRWHNRIAESRELISQQLHGVSGIVKCLSDEIDMSLRFHEGLEEEMIMELLKQKIEVHSVIVLDAGVGKYRVSMTHRACHGKNTCKKHILPVLEGVLKRKMRVESTGCHTRGGKCFTRFAEAAKWQVSSGIASRAKSTRGSGDSYTAMELTGGTTLLALSDGMGSGDRARRESAATVGLLEDFIESGFDKELAVRMINSVLVLKSGEESFSTLDICSIDQYTGFAEFIKIGAAATYILRDGAITAIQNAALPIGMLNDVDFTRTEQALQHGDYIIMITDGIDDNLTRQALAATPPTNPQTLAEYILAPPPLSPTPKDDMTVLAARIHRRAA